MSRKTATATAQPDLLGGVAQPEPNAQMRAMAKPKRAAKARKPEPAKADAKVATIKPAKPKTQLAVVPPSPGSVLTALVAAASNPAIDPANMRALLDMQKEIMAEMARMAFTEDFIALQAVMPVIRKDGKIIIPPKDGKRGQETPYATFQNIHRVVSPLLKQHNFALSFATEPSADGARILVRGILEHTKGHKRETVFPLPAEVSGSKNNVQGWGSSFSYGKRYAAIALLNLVSDANEDADTDGVRRTIARGQDGSGKVIDGEVLDADDGIQKITEKQADTLIEAIEATGKTRKDFCGAWHIAKVADLPAEHFRRAMDACAALSSSKGKS